MTLKNNSYIEFQRLCKTYDQYKDIIELNDDELKEIFNKVFFINYLSNRQETKHCFKNDYFILSFSYLIESYSCLLLNRPKASALLLRSSLENFLKFYIANLGYKKEINDRKYSANYRLFTSETINLNANKFKYEILVINEKLQSLYSLLSGMSHSLTKGNQAALFSYFSDLHEYNEISYKDTLTKFNKYLEYICELSIYISSDSLLYWETEDLNNLLDLIYGKKRKLKIIEKIRAI